jgi:type IX secretion system PorP/SprF family membrane protein
MKLRIIFLLLIGAAIQQFGFSQDPHFSQIQYNPVYLNPANAGFAKKDNRIVGVYRDQWRAASSPYSTTFGSYDRKLKQWSSGWRLGGGVSFLYDRAGDGVLSTFNPNLTLAVGKFFNSAKQLINIGITSGLTLKSLDYSKLTFDNQYIAGGGYDPGNSTGETFSNNNASFPNFTIGLNFTTKMGEKSNLDIGGAASNLHEPNQNFLYFSESKLPARYTAYAKALVGLGKKDKWNIQPGVIYNFQNKASDILANLIAETRFKENDKGKSLGLGFGAGYRARDVDAAIAYVSVLYGDLRVGVSYDINVSDYRKASNTVGAFEVLLSYEWGNSSDNKKKKLDTIRIREFEIAFDTIYLAEADTVFVKEDCDTPFTLIEDVQIAQWNEKLTKLLPAIAYFDNDMPDPRSKSTTTTANFKDLYDAYIAKKPQYVESVGDSAANEIFNTVTAEYEKLQEIYSTLRDVLEAGKEVRLQFLGYASPLANANYNMILSKRRIESVKNYLLGLDDGSIKQYIDNHQLIIEILPLGKSAAPTDISDRLSDVKNSIFGKNASMERKVEIKYILIK